MKRADRYDPELNPTYAELARHYGVAVIPARPRKPRDKAKVEAAVLLAERWIIAVLRHRTFHSLEELRAAVAPLVERLNDRPMRRLKKSRRQLFEEMERATLRALPARPYEMAEWKRMSLGFDYHVEFGDHYYSIHFKHIGEELDLRATESTVEIFLRGKRLESYARSYEKWKYTTRKEHMPRAHLDQVDWTPERIIDWAKKIGPQTAVLIQAMLNAPPHPQQAFKKCMGVLSLGRQYEAVRIEGACARALRVQALNCRSIRAILKNNLDRAPLPGDEPLQVLPLHQNIRGSRYYH